MLKSLNHLPHLSAFVVLACSAALLSLVSGCAHSSSPASTATPVTTTPPTPSTVTDVYVGGEDYINGVAIATVWKNGVASQIGTPGFVSHVGSIANVRSDIYAAGVQSDGINFKPTIWKNGVATTLQSPLGYGLANSIAVSGADVYVCGNGLDAKSGLGSSLLWKNGVWTILPMSEAQAVAISGTDVYVTGGMFFAVTAPNVERTAAIVVKNGVATNLDAANTYYRSYGSSTFVQGNDVYVGGSLQSTASGTSAATVWKNGVPAQLSTDNGYVPSVFANGADIYAGGNHGFPLVSDGTSSGAATVWKNGIASDYSVDAAQSIVLQVTVSSGTLYAVGFTDKGAYLWKDGVPTVLPSISTKATATAIAVYQH